MYIILIYYYLCNRGLRNIAAVRYSYGGGYPVTVYQIEIRRRTSQRIFRAQGDWIFPPFARIPLTTRKPTTPPLCQEPRTLSLHHDQPIVSALVSQWTTTNPPPPHYHSRARAHTHTHRPRIYYIYIANCSVPAATTATGTFGRGFI